MGAQGTGCLKRGADLGALHLTALQGAGEGVILTKTRCSWARIFEQRSRLGGLVQKTFPGADVICAAKASRAPQCDLPAGTRKNLRGGSGHAQSSSHTGKALQAIELLLGMRLPREDTSIHG
jgi:hypothetical protein